MPGRRIFWRGREYVSTGLTASMLGTSKRTVARYIRAGMLSPAPLDRGMAGQHWFLVEDVEQLAQLRNQGLLAPRDGAHASSRPFSSFTTAARRALRLEAGEDEGWTSPAEERGDQLAAADPPRPAAIAPLCCPQCGAELLTISAGVRGARPDLNEILFCETCQTVVDLTEAPEPGDNDCPVCREELAYWEDRDDGEAGQQGRCATHGVVALCDQHGVVEGRPRPVVQPYVHPVAGYSTSTPTQLSRGKQARAWPGDVVGAVRKPPPPPGPPTPTWLPPFEVGH